MNLLKRNTKSPARELRGLKPRLRDAQKELARFEAEAEAAVAEREAVLARDADAYLGAIDPAEHDQERGRAEERVRLATETRDRQGRIVEELERRCAKLEQKGEAENVAKADREREEAAVEEARLEAALDAARQRTAEKETQAALVRASARWAGAEYDPDIRTEAVAEEKHYAGTVTWFAQNPHADDRIPVELRARVEKERVRLRKEVEAYNQALRTEAEESWRASGIEPPFEERGVGEVRDHEEWPRLARH
jgi:hypothetical protein